MRKPQELSGALMGGAAFLLATQPVMAAATPVTGVRLNPTPNSLEITLETQIGKSSDAKSAQRPQVYTVNNGNDSIANLLNTELRLPQGNFWQQDNPMPGISSVVISQADGNSIKVVVKGENSAPKGQIIAGKGNGITLSFRPSATAPNAQLPSNSAVSPTLTAANSQSVLPPIPKLDNSDLVAQSAPPAPAPAPAMPTLPKPDVLMPNPEITINGQPAPAAGTVQPVAPAPPLLPRAIAPPVGDIAVSNINVSTPTIDLGTGARVPRLVLRDAPVREVLTLLARTAGMNVAFADNVAAATTPGATATPGATPTAGSTISIDIENESVQNVFNYVLRLSGLEANRNDRTIFVASRLPDAARNLVMRTLRLNQIKATMPETNITITQNSSSSVSSGGGTGGASTTSGLGRTTASTQNIPMRGALQILESLGANGGGTTAGAPGAVTTNAGIRTLNGLQAIADARTNSITLIGTPNLVEIATSKLIELDVRKRQVAVNVKIVEVTLQNAENFGGSFSFGVANNFFSVDQGSFTANIGQFRTPTATEVRTSLTGRPTITNPFADAQTFINPNSTISIFAGEGSQTINNGFLTSVIPRNSTFFNRNLVINDPFAPGITDITNGTPDITTITTTGTPPVTTSTFAQGTRAIATSGLPSLFQFPTRLLATLQAQIQSGNAKVLTDPTLIVQEGSQSQVNLTQQVFSGFTESRITEGNQTTTRTLPQAPIDVGVILNINVDQIDDNGFINMAVSPEVSSPGQQITDPSRNNLLIQQLVNRRRLETGNIRLRDGQTLILTGVIQEIDRTTVSKVPILGDLPLIGSLFRSTNRQNQRQEVIVLVTPQIMDDSDRSSFGYNYTPSPDTRQFLQQRGFATQGR